MPSQINILVTNIDENYPVAGVDNDTQGFRDNFDIIKSSLAFAGQEITSLQDTTAKITGENDFSGNLIINADLIGVTERSSGLTPFTNPDAATNTILFRDGSHQRAIIAYDNADITINWGPTGSSTLETDRYAKLILEVIADEGDEEYNVVFSAPGGEIKYSTNWPINFRATGSPQFVEVSTYTAGGTVFLQYLGEYSQIGDPLNYYNYQNKAERVVSGLIDLEVMSTYFETAASGSFSSTLPAGVPGQIKTLIMKQDGGQDMTVSVADAGWLPDGSGSIVFTAVGQACTLQFIENKWYCTGNNGATFA
jgi:hypothetical protein